MTTKTETKYTISTEPYIIGSGSFARKVWRSDVKANGKGFDYVIRSTKEEAIHDAMKLINERGGERANRLTVTAGDWR